MKTYLRDRFQPVYSGILCLLSFRAVFSSNELLKRAVQFYWWGIFSCTFLVRWKMGANKSDADGFPLKQLSPLSALHSRTPPTPTANQTRAWASTTFHVVSISTSPPWLIEWWQFGLLVPRSSIVLSLICMLMPAWTSQQSDQGNHLAEECLSSDEGTPQALKSYMCWRGQYLEQEVEEFVGKDRQSLLASGRIFCQGTPGTGFSWNWGPGLRPAGQERGGLWNPGPLLGKIGKKGIMKGFRTKREAYCY